jgi:hypothetical protein
MKRRNFITLLELFQSHTVFFWSAKISSRIPDARSSSAAERKRIGLVMPPAAACDLPIQIEHLP